MSLHNDELLGYLLNALEPTEHARVESELVNDPDATQRLESLRTALSPLAFDDVPDEPPSGLAVRTIARVAEYIVDQEWGGSFASTNVDQASEDDWFDPFSTPSQSSVELIFRRPEPIAPAITPAEAPTGPIGWRRGNVAVAICLGLIVIGMSIPVVSSFQRRAQVMTCQNNLRSLYHSLAGYAENHSGYLPMITGEPPYHEARAFVPILAEAGQWPGAIDPCPASLTAMKHDQLTTSPPYHQLGNTYAYSLGYRNEEQRLRGLRLDPDTPENTYLPVAADRGSNDTSHWNAAHGGGQNVLFLGGNVRFCSSIHVGVNGDSIYTNQAGRIGAGLHRWDSVLGVGSDMP